MLIFELGSGCIDFGKGVFECLESKQPVHERLVVPLENPGIHINSARSTDLMHQFSPCCSSCKSKSQAQASPAKLEKGHDETIESVEERKRRNDMLEICSNDECLLSTKDAG